MYSTRIQNIDTISLIKVGCPYQRNGITTNELKPENKLQCELLYYAYELNFSYKFYKSFDIWCESSDV